MSSFHWVDSNSDSFAGFISNNVRFLISFWKLNQSWQVLGSSFYPPFLVSFSLLMAGFFRSEKWWAFKNPRLKFGEKESCGSCGEEKRFGRWRWIQVSQQGAAADLLLSSFQKFSVVDICSNCSWVIGVPKLMQFLIQILCMSRMIQIQINPSGAIRIFPCPHSKCVGAAGY